MSDGPLGAAASIEEIGTAFVGDGGVLVLGGAASVRGDGGLFSSDDVLASDRLACTEPGGAVGEVGATAGQLSPPACEVVAAITDVIGHLLVVAAPGHGAPPVMFWKATPSSRESSTAPS
jgi:hypothetical protein